MNRTAGRLFHMVAFLSVLLAFVAGVFTIWVTGPLVEPEALPLQVEGLLVSFFLLEFGLLMKFQGTLGDCLPRQGSREAFQMGGRERSLRRLATFVYTLGMLLFALALALRLDLGTRALADSAVGPTLALLKQHGNVPALGFLAANALLAFALLILCSSLSARFQKSGREAAGLMTAITGAPQLDE